MSSTFRKFVTAFDIYGWPINMNYHGNELYRTLMGSFCSLVTIVVILVNFATLAISYLDGSRQTEKHQALDFDRYHAGQFSLSDNLFDLKVLVYAPIPENIGRLRMVAA